MKRTWIIVTVLIVAFLGLVGYTVTQKIDIKNIDTNAYIEGSSENGNIADHVDGDKDAAVLLFEYADFQCSGCASSYPYTIAAIDSYEDGQVALVFRNYVLSYHKNGRAAAKSANAAGLQGYWAPYAKKLFANQNEWYYSEGEQLENYFKQYLREVSDGKADEEKFMTDYRSEAVDNKLNFDIKLAKKVDLKATPTYIIGGETLDFSTLDKQGFVGLIFDKIDAQLRAKGIEPKHGTVEEISKAVEKEQPAASDAAAEKSSE